METKFAPAKRSSFESIIKDNLKLDNIPFLNDIFCSLSYIFCTLDESRQIVFTYDILLKILGVENVNQVLVSVSAKVNE